MAVDDTRNPDVSVEKGFLIPNDAVDRKITSTSHVPGTWDQASLYRDMAQQGAGSGEGGSNINLGVDAGEIVGSIPITKGGTGQTTKDEGFDALSPLSTKGDILSHDGTDNVRVGVGNDQQAVIADSTDTNGVVFSTTTWMPNMWRRFWGTRKLHTGATTLGNVGWERHAGEIMAVNSAATSSLDDATGAYNNMTTGALTNQYAGWQDTTGLYMPCQLQHRLVHHVVCKTGANATDITVCRIWIILTSGSPGPGDSDTPAFHYIGFRYSTIAADAGWMSISDSATASPELQSTGVGLSADTRYVLTIDCTNPASVKFYVNGVYKTTHATTLPGSTTDLYCYAILKTKENVDKAFRISSVFTSSD